MYDWVSSIFNKTTLVRLFKTDSIVYSDIMPDNYTAEIRNRQQMWSKRVIWK